MGPAKRKVGQDPCGLDNRARREKRREHTPPFGHPSREGMLLLVY